MTPYNIYNEDCLEGMKKIEAGSVALILTDPLFGTTDCYFDKKLPLEPMWEQFKRVAKQNAAIILFSQMPFGAELIMSNRKMFRYEWIFEKSLGVGFLNAKKMPLRCHENILVFYQKLPTYNPQFTRGKPYKARPTSFSLNYQHQKQTTQNNDGYRYPKDILSGKYDQLKYHPQQKPIALLEYLIKTYTNEGEMVLDTTMGSGSTGVAAINTNRRFIGFEIEKKFYDIAEKRISEAIVQREQSLFR